MKSLFDLFILILFDPRKVCPSESEGEEFSTFAGTRFCSFCKLLSRPIQYIGLLFFSSFLLISCQSTVRQNPYNVEAEINRLPSSFKRGINNTPSHEKRPCDLKQGSAVVLMYHKFDEPYKSTSVTIEQFIEQMEFFKNNGYKVVSLGKIVSAAKGDIPFGEKWIAITIDDAYKSFLKAKPILETYQYPYTIFVNTQAVDENYKSSMSWDDLRTIVQSGLGELAAHSHTHGHLVQDMNSEQRKRDILVSVERIFQNTSTMPRFFSYPFGEVSNNLIEEIKNMNQVILGKSFYFEAAFSTQSGPVGCSSDLFTLPRFAINEKYGVIDDLFKIKVNSVHLPIYDYHPKNKAVCVEQQVSKVYFSTDSHIDLESMRCYASRGNSARVNISNGLVTVELEKPLGHGLSNPNDIRERLNCTAYYKRGFIWYGREFTILKNSAECSK
ncbi:MAG: polysaccharide deacetylase family protein [Oligoflexia bacterium]|nr:polysaccharide deacetylase family protein [Oligoflexia bacterium]